MDIDAKAREVASAIALIYGIGYSASPAGVGGLIVPALREAVEAEREACAQLIDDHFSDPSDQFAGDIIRGRSKE